MTEVLAIIPARGGSKRLPGKNIKKFCGKPLIAWTIEAAKRSAHITRTIVTTDDPRIAAVAKRYGAEVPFLRPAHLASDTAKTIDVVEHTLTFLREKENYVPAYLCLLQPTAPLRTARHIDEAFKSMLAAKADACVSVTPTKLNPYLANTIDKGMYKPYIKGTGRTFVAKLKPQAIYQLNGAIYLIRPGIFLRERTFEPKRTAAYVMQEYDSTDIDTLDDFLVAAFIKLRLPHADR